MKYNTVKVGGTKLIANPSSTIRHGHGTQFLISEIRITLFQHYIDHYSCTQE